MRAVSIAVFHVLLILAYVSFCPFAASAQTVRTGETHTGMVAICDKVEDAATLIGLTTKYGQKTAIGWMQEDDNTCTLIPVTFKVGEVELDGVKAKDGANWMVLGVTVDDKPAYIVAPSALYQSTSY